MSNLLIMIIVLLLAGGLIPLFATIAYKFGVHVGRKIQARSR